MWVPITGSSVCGVRSTGAMADRDRVGDQIAPPPGSPIPQREDHWRGRRARSVLRPSGFGVDQGAGHPDQGLRGGARKAGHDLVMTGHELSNGSWAAASSVPWSQPRPGSKSLCSRFNCEGRCLFPGGQFVPKRRIQSAIFSGGARACLAGSLHLCAPPALLAARAVPWPGPPTGPAHQARDRLAAAMRGPR